MNVIAVIVFALFITVNCQLFDNGGPLRSVLDSFERLGDESREETDKEFDSFDPSVVVVDKNLNSDEQNFGGFKPIWSIRRPNPWRSWVFAFKRPQPWWKGANVCVERKELDGSKNLKGDAENSTEKDAHRSSFTFSSQTTQCVESDSSYVCKTHVSNDKFNKTTIVKYECCHGFKRKGSSGCSQVNLKSLRETMKDIGVNKFLESMSSERIDETIGVQNVTVITPTNDVWIEYAGTFNKKENEISMIARQESFSNSVVLPAMRHLFPGIMKSGDFVDGQILTSIDNETKVRVNVYEIPKRVVTVNCAPIITANTMATNGIIHVVDRVLPISNQTIGEQIEANPEFTRFRKLLERVGLMQKLKSTTGLYTVFAVKDEAMEKLEPSLLEKLENRHSCFDSIAESHVVEKVICSSAIFNQFKVTSSASHPLTLKRTYEQKLLVDGIELNTRDIIATNGVIHVIKDLIIPEKVKPVSKVIEHSITTDFWKLLNENGLIDEWNSKENVTFFIPTNEAIKNFKNNKEFVNSTEDVLNLHVMNSVLKSDSLYNNEMIQTANGKAVRINLYADLPETFMKDSFARSTIQCSNILFQNKEVCGGVVHLVDKVILPSQQNLMDALNSSPNFSIFKQIVKISGLEPKFISENGPFTLLVPKDKAFNEQMSPEKLEEYMKDQKKAMKLVQKHVIPEFLCCSGVSQMPLLFSLQQFRTMDGSSLSAFRDFEGKIKFGSATVKKCDSLAENGVIHVIDRVLQPRQQSTSAVHPLFHVFMN